MFYVTTNDAARRAQWEKLFGADRLPVKLPRPRLQAMGEREVLAFDLDARRLHPMSMARFAAWVSRETGVKHAPGEMDGWPIPAAGCQLIGAGVGVGVGQHDFSYGRVAA